MPYIIQKLREEFANDQNRWAENVGELNFNVTSAIGIYGPSPTARTIIVEFIRQYLIIKGLSYQTINDIMGVLICVEYEISRRLGETHLDLLDFISDTMTDFYITIAEPYEDRKIKENGDLEVFKGVE